MSSISNAFQYQPNTFRKKLLQQDEINNIRYLVVTCFFTINTCLSHNYSNAIPPSLFLLLKKAAHICCIRRHRRPVLFTVHGNCYLFPKERVYTARGKITHNDEYFSSLRNCQTWPVCCWLSRKCYYVLGNWKIHELSSAIY